MKSITAWGIAMLAATIASYVNADGVCYDPNHGSGANIGNVAGDMQTIKSKGFSHVRTYISAIGGTDMASIVASSGLRSALGVPYPDPDYKVHIENAVNAANKYGTVDYIFVGNENLPGRGNSGEMAAIINDIKRRVSGNVKVGTVQTSAAYIYHQVGDELLNAATAVGVNIHPFFNPNTAVANKQAIKVTTSQWNDVKAALNGNGYKLILTETGWPTDGNNGNQGSQPAAQQYFSDYKEWSSFLADSQKFYFQAFDTTYKSQQYEKTFGLIGKYGGGSTSATTTAPPVTTPPPTTTAPTATAPATTEPAANATASATGSAAGESDLPAGSSSHSGNTEVGADNDSNTDLGIAGANEDTTIDGTPAPGTSTDAGATETGGNTSDKTTEANTQSAQGKSSIAGIVVVVLFGCAAIGAAFGFIWKARQKAKEIEESESKDFEHSITNTPGGACVL